MDIKVCMGGFPPFVHNPVYRTQKLYIWGIKVSLDLYYDKLYDAHGTFVTERLNKQLNLK